jgi:hypothetical protein
MPPVDPNGSGSREPLSVPVHVFRGALKPIKTLDPKPSSFVATVRSDAQGHYRATLTPGTYTVVAEIGGGLYLNSLDAFGNWTTIVVETGRITTWNIDDTSKATY